MTATNLPSPVSIGGYLKRYFGFSQLREGQEASIGMLLKGKDCLVLMPTGGGKSICYQLPALMLDGLTVVVCPLISLMQDQVQQLKAQGISAEYLNSSISQDEEQAIYREMGEGKIKIVYVAPERLMRGQFLEHLSELKIAMIAIDEAHCVSHWGHDFRTDYRALSKLKQVFPTTPLIALTATADPATRQDIIHQLHLDDPFVYSGSFDRPNIRYSLLSKYKGFDQVLSFVQQQGDNAGIVYCSSKAKVDDLALKLKNNGIAADAYHAGHDNRHRASVQNKFLRDELQVVVATVAFGMGINKSNVRFVVHHDVPRSIESFYQETGRAGRDGLAAEALLLYDERDAVRIRKWIAEGSQPERFEIDMHKFDAMQSFAEAQTCRRQVLLNYFGDYSSEACGNCDVCNDPPQMFDASIETRKLLSCIYRLRMDTSFQTVIDVLKGKSLRKLLDKQYDQLSTYGIGKDKPDNYWHGLLQQLVHQGLISIDLTRNGNLVLTDAARPVLRGENPVSLAVPRLSVNTTKKKEPMPKNIDRALFAKLKHLRKTIAEEGQVPAYVVFSDASLADMASRLPTSQSAFLQVSGVGNTKLMRYGDAFIALITKHLG
ncbi:MAG: DNA helicase RecQ [Pseudomonadota bacterium]